MELGSRVGTHKALDSSHMDDDDAVFNSLSFLSFFCATGQEATGSKSGLKLLGSEPATGSRMASSVGATR